MSQRISPLEPADLADLDAKREWAAGHLAEGAQPGFEHPGTKLNILQAILDNGWAAGDDLKLQALGVVFGDVLAGLIDAPWVIVEDEWGRDPGLLISQEHVILQFPMTMIAKRVQAGESVDVTELVAGAARQALEMRQQAASAN